MSEEPYEQPSYEDDYDMYMLEAASAIARTSLRPSPPTQCNQHAHEVAEEISKLRSLIEKQKDPVLMIGLAVMLGYVLGRWRK